MEQALADTIATPTDFVLFGGTGDLARKKLLPSLYYLFNERRLPRVFRLIGAARAAPEQGYEAFVRQAVQEGVEPAYLDGETLDLFVDSVRFAPIDAAASDGLAGLAALLDEAADRRRAFYFATPPTLYVPLVQALAANGLNDDRATVALEKPIGKDLASAVAINQALAAAFPESRVFRVDHYLGKATVQNLLALRFGNAILEPMWSGRFIDHVQITVAEETGVEGRHDYYDGVGALRDMVQNHIIQLLCLVAMECPSRLSGSAVRAEKLKVVSALRPITGAAVLSETVRGQYAAGRIGGKDVPAYADSGDPHTETFVAVTAEVNNWRWERAPFFLRTGKRMGSRETEIVIQFKSVPHSIFRGGDGGGLTPNQLIILLQPEEDIILSLMGSRPGLGLGRLELEPMSLSLSRVNDKPRRRLIAYERLIADWLEGDTTLFVGREEVEESWRWIDGIVQGWRQQGMAPIPYEAGGWGPPRTETMLAERGARWRNPEGRDG
jgi:glucose-6-phosphate 1-dehydrogenase